MDALLTALAGTATTVVGYIASAAAAGLTVFAAIYGVRWIIRTFKTVK